MEGFCCTLLSMSLAAALTALGVMVARLFLYKLPRALICGLWLVVLFRMACPVSVSLPVGLVPQGVADGSIAQFVLSSSRPLPSGAQVAPPTGGTPEGTQTAPAPEDSPSETTVAETPHWPAIAFGVWAAGAAVAALWGVVTYCRLRNRIDDAVLLSEHIYETDQIDSPFVLGFFRPRIYLPVGLTEQERRYVLLHEQAHIRRWDHRFKPLAYALLCLHWFDPILWIAYRLLCLDIEMATDQAVLRRLDHEEHTSPTEYAAALLHLSRDPRVPSAVPLAFGEEDAKERIVSLLRYRRPVMGVLVAAALVCLVLGVGFAGNHSTAAPRPGPDPHHPGNADRGNRPRGPDRGPAAGSCRASKPHKEKQLHPLRRPRKAGGDGQSLQSRRLCRVPSPVSGDGPAPAGPGPQHRRDAHLPQRRLLLF